jgi:ribose-phosphate pyrophosphokinase
MKIFTGSANRALGESVSRYLKVPLGKVHLSRFLDGEVWFQIEENVRGKDVFVLQSTSTPVNEHLMELLIMIDAFKRASAARITAVIPYYGYARQDRKDRPRVPISAKLVANLISVAGCNRVLTMDLHASQIQGFFDVPVDHLFAAPVIIDYVAQMGLEDLCVVSPDAGGVERARAYAKRLGATLAIVDKRRETANVAEVHNVIGEVSGKTVLIVDDLVDTGGTLCKVAEALAEAGAGKILASASHGVLSGHAVRNINASRIAQLIVTDSIEERPERKSDKIVVLPIGELMGKAIQNIHEEASVTSLFI